eukprot:CAMPEP_0204569134 /NCGR_PEP_ID=MMETSP0661-20131031/37578_1 /ASSEMBLY_ACC=CAM_ASM_000606 /TAXON_ID=109239 /ORGANISM="Alexandrium margalefi, Strain AMGDE01CS-322" /LENGTH=186 /DNA_ID=CAMNT_0051577215 /DNA_START=14 /DNA_END=574 /DNA_ORIENTATION=-
MTSTRKHHYTTNLLNSGPLSGRGTRTLRKFWTLYRLALDRLATPLMEMAEVAKPMAPATPRRPLEHAGPAGTHPACVEQGAEGERRGVLPHLGEPLDLAEADHVLTAGDPSGCLAAPEPHVLELRGANSVPRGPNYDGRLLIVQVAGPRLGLAREIVRFVAHGEVLPYAHVGGCLNGLTCSPLWRR